MAEVFTSDNSVPTEVMESMAAEEADSLAVGEELQEAHEAKLAGKYNSTEELEAAYLELQKKLGSNEEEAAEETQEESSTDWLQDAYSNYLENGTLDEASTQKLNEMSSVDVFEALTKNPVQPVARDLTDAEVSSIYDTVGGKEAYTEIVSWAKDSFTAEEIQAYDAMIETGNISQINLALLGLYSQYTDAMGSEGNMLQGKPAEAQSTFRSQAELIQAMNDPRYESDPAYRNDVIEKLGRSDLNF
tara:strand:- start:73 stop:810 length:738 start_codon:yes stop_codon:yes gene_type:complete